MQRRATPGDAGKNAQAIPGSGIEEMQACGHNAFEVPASWMTSYGRHGCPLAQLQGY